MTMTSRLLLIPLLVVTVILLPKARAQHRNSTTWDLLLPLANNIPLNSATEYIREVDPKRRLKLGNSPNGCVTNGSFLNGDLEEEIYMNQPEGFIAPGQEGKIIRTKNGLVLSQAYYVDKILNTHNARDSGQARTPIDTSTRPDLAYAVSRLSSRDYGLHYDRHPAVIEGYSDANWISNIKDSRSTSGYVFTLGGAIYLEVFQAKLYVRSGCTTTLNVVPWKTDGESVLREATTCELLPSLATNIGLDIRELDSKRHLLWNTSRTSSTSERPGIVKELNEELTRDASMGLCECGNDECRSLQNGTWSSIMSLLVNIESQVIIQTFKSSQDIY
ncbi:zinc finger, CCHC-type containing protein [Tanacetum coccineum]